MTKRQKQIGDAGQNLAANALRQLDVRMVEKIGTPVKCLPTSRPGVFTVIWGEKVAGDHRGVLVGGRSVLAETKTILDRNLRWSDFREHQPAALSEHAELGGLSLVVWVHSSGVYVMRWPIPDFASGCSIAPDWAAEYDEETREEMGFPF